MATIKDLYENEELMENIVEDLDDLPEETEVFYSVWALGHDKNNDPTDDEVLVGEFTDPDAAVEYARNLTLEQVNELGFGEPCVNTVFFTVEVETVIGDPYDEDGGTLNLGTVFARDLWLECESICDTDGI